MKETIKEIDFLDPPAMDFEDIFLKLEKTERADNERGFFPCDCFGIFLKGTETKVGGINFKIGETKDLIRYGGHIGYGIAEEHRGNGYASKACLALRKFIAVYYDEVIITCNPDNIPSVRSVEKLGATFIEIVEVPKGNPTLARNPNRIRSRYSWKINKPQ